MDEIATKLIEIIQKITDIEVSLDSSLLDDLSVDSLGLLLLISRIEEEFKVKIPEEMVEDFDTVNDIYSFIISK